MKPQNNNSAGPAFTDEAWGEAAAFGGTGRDVVDALVRLQAMRSGAWTLEEGGAEFARLTHLLKDGSESSAASRLAEPWLVHLAIQRPGSEASLPLQLLGELWLNELWNARSLRVDLLKEIERAIESSRSTPDASPFAADLRAAFYVLPVINDNYQFVVLRLVVLGQQYGKCRCGEILDYDIDGEWHVGDEEVSSSAAVPEKDLGPIAAISSRARVVGSEALTKIERIFSPVGCQYCGRTFEFIDLLRQT